MTQVHTLSFAVRRLASRTHDSCFYDFLIDDESLAHRLRPNDFNLASAIGWGDEDACSDVVAALLGSPTGLPDGRVPLYLCPIDGDLDCGAVVVKVTVTDTIVTWSDFGRAELSYGVEGEPYDPGADVVYPEVEPVSFDREQYERALRSLTFPAAQPAQSIPVIRRDRSEFIYVSSGDVLVEWLEPQLVSEALASGEYQVWDADGNELVVSVEGEQIVLRPGGPGQDEQFRRMLAPLCTLTVDDPPTFAAISEKLAALQLPDFTMLCLWPEEKGRVKATSADWHRPWEPKHQWTPEKGLQRTPLRRRF